MIESLSLPESLCALKRKTFCICESPYPALKECMLDLWRQSQKEGWVHFSDLPCTLDLHKYGLYQGYPKLSLIAPSASNDNVTSYWSWHADRAGSMLLKIARKLQARLLSFSFCSDLSALDAVAEMYCIDGNHAGAERLVRVMRDDNGRLEFLQAGLPLEFEDLENYRRRQIKDRLNDQVLQTYLVGLGINIDREYAAWSNRQGFACIWSLKPLNA